MTLDDVLADLETEDFDPVLEAEIAAEDLAMMLFPLPEEKRRSVLQVFRQALEQNERFHREQADHAAAGSAQAAR